MTTIAQKIPYQPRTGSRRSTRRGLSRAGGLRRSTQSVLGASDRDLRMDSLRILEVQRSFYGTNRNTASLEDSFWDEDQELLLERAVKALSQGPPRLSIVAPKPAEENKTLEEMTTQARDSLTKDGEQYEMEIEPGFYVPFRGAQEVWQAVDTETTLECCCMECGLDLVCVADCDHVICPDCRMVNPIFDRPAFVTAAPYGAGIGLKKEWIQQQNQQPTSVKKAMAA